MAGDDESKCRYCKATVPRIEAAAHARACH
jgi:hypothetical protein